MAVVDVICDRTACIHNEDKRCMSEREIEIGGDLTCRSYKERDEKEAPDEPAQT